MSVTRSNVWALVGLLGALVTGLYFVVPSSLLKGTVFVCIVAMTGLCVLAGIRLHRPEIPRPWLWLAYGLGFKVIGDVVWYAENLFGGGDILVVPAQLCYLVSYGCFIASFFVFVRLRDVRNYRAILLDTAMLLVNAIAACWIFLIHPLLAQSPLPLLERIVFTSFPVVNLVVFGALVALLLSNGARPPALYFLTAGFLLHLLGDTVYYAGVLWHDSYTIGGAQDALWLLAYVLIAVAALRPSMEQLTRPSAATVAPLTRARTLWFGLSAMLGPAVIVIHHSSGITMQEVTIIAAGLVLFALILIRMAGLVHAVQSRVVELQLSQHKYRALAHNFPSGAVFLFDHDLRFLVADGAGLHQAGFSPGRLEGRTLHEVLPQSTAALLETHYRSALAGKQTAGEIEFHGAAYEIHGTPVQDERGEVFAGLVLAQDVTKRKWAETLLEQQATTLEMILDGGHHKDVLEHIATTVEAHAPGAQCSIQLLSNDGTSLGHGAAPSLPATYNHAIDGVAIGPTVGSWGAAAFRGETVIVSDIATDPLWRDFKDLALIHDLRACWSVPMSDAEGKTLGTFGVYYDRPMEPPLDHTEIVRLFSRLAGIAVERHRAAEKGKELENQLRQSQKMEAIGQLAGGIAHDFNNILSVIRNYAGFVRDEFGPDDPARDDVAEIVHASDRASELVRQLLAFSRKDVLDPQMLDLNDVVADTHKLLRRTMSENLSLAVELTPGNLKTRLDSGQLEQVLLNLVVNARDAMPDGGALTIETGYEIVDHRNSRQHSKLKEGHYVRLSVRDTGCGMTDEVKVRIFEPFFTTKRPGEGTGLGLAMVYGIVEGAGGHIAVDSTPGKGSSFTLYFPASDAEKSETVEEPALNALPVADGARILVVEDEEAVRKLIGRILSGRGYRVVEARSGDHALARLAEVDGDVELMLTDVRMPGMSGRELALNVQMLYPRIKTLYMSGYAEQSLAEESLRGLDSWIEKPFSAEALVALIHKTLDAPSLVGTGRAVTP